MERKLKLSHLKAWGALHVAHYEALKRIEKDLEPVISFTWYDILFIVNSSPNHRKRMSEVAEFVVLSKSALTRAIDALEKEGLLTRVSCPADGRVSYASITPKGQNRLKTAWPVYRKALQKYFGSKLTIQEAKTLAQILGKFVPPRG